MKETTFYGAETVKALSSFGRDQTPPELIKAYGEVKKAALASQQECFGLYEPDLYERIVRAVDEIIDGKHNSQFPLPLRQGGAGTSLHMNINEVICALASKEGEVDPLEDAARFQSTNDTFSTALIVMVYRQLQEVEELVIALQEVLVRTEERYGSILMTGRTELQDALPITAGQIFASWAGSVERDRWRLHKLKERLRTIPLGGTAMGTCFSAPRKYVFKAEQNLRKITGLPLCRSQNLTDAVSSQDNLAETASGLKLLSLNLIKMTGDLLLYTSSLSGEFTQGELQYGSTIMPYKSNPVVLEFVRGLALSVKHECAKIEEYASEGQLQLNAYLPFMAHSFIEANAMLKKGLTALLERFFPQLTPDREKMMMNLISSPAIVNTLRPVLGYGRIKDLVPLIKSRKPASLTEVIEIVEENSDLSRSFLEKWFDPANLTTYTNEFKEP